MPSAAQYIRMSTEHQRYSIEAQEAANAAYATAHGLNLVRTYMDCGVSGLRLDGRHGLKSLLADIMAGDPGYTVVLVYDVSRWGRFQDPDEAGHYEFLCRQAGVRIDYTTEPFDNDESLTGTLVKHLKRAMAAEYSRELSHKVAHAKRGLARKGFWVNGACSYGYRRRMIHPDGRLGQVLQKGQRKGLKECRIVLVEGPAEEVSVVRRIFREYLVHGLSVKAIARGLNAEDIANPQGARWTKSHVMRLLENEIYSGVIVVGRYATHLRVTRRQPPEAEVRLEGACPALISRAMFELTQANLRTRPQQPPEHVLLDQLRRLWKLRGKLSQHIVNDDPDTYCASVFQQRFGGLMEAYARIGYQPSYHQRAAYSARMRQVAPSYVPPPVQFTEDEMLQGARDLWFFHGRLSSQLIDMAPHLPSAWTYGARFGGMRGLYERIGYEPSVSQKRRLSARPRKKPAHMLSAPGALHASDLWTSAL
ncbi:MAG: recombinase family protein [Alphaproteobacteria bacterium]|nr:recombinase family protein [Alphaproteobacteria bacterium]MBU1515633.1 recombinase family protein [Alphaproteobacteria bacterium]MBU2094892.1 recombinase family protein [Alphaproteobacteria bacterium]MBU2150924.1 recombinase family protein [Alphaproteobacteria bacterium]MBU2305901.1 recombinase family protein [Alphaproteobacteria bacterium]